MLKLIPAELWDYPPSVLVSGLAAVLSRDPQASAFLLPQIGECIPTRSARAALVHALKALELPEGSHVGVPLYCCAVVLKAIVAAGCVPRFLDVEPQTFCLSAEDVQRKSADLSAIVAVHMFGNVCDVPAVQRVAAGVPIIEDCALSLGSKLGEAMTGALGDVAIFSFRSGKYLSVGEGGALYSSHPSVRAAVGREMSVLPSVGLAEELVHVAKTFLRSSLRSQPLYGPIGFPLWKSYNARTEYSDKATVVVGRAFRSDISIASKRIAKLSRLIEKQRANAAFYASKLKLKPEMLCSEAPGRFYNRYQFPITFPTPELCDAMRQYLYRRGVDCSRPVTDIAEIAARYYNYQSDCPVAESLAKRVLVVPSYYTLTPFELGHVADSINAGWGELSGCAAPRSVHRATEVVTSAVGQVT